MHLAVDDVIKNKMPLKRAAATHNICVMILKRKVRAIRGGAEVVSAPYRSSSIKVFTTIEEKQLKQYIFDASKMGYGLSPSKLRSLAYDFAVKLGKRLPHSKKGQTSSWMTKKEAGADWQRSFCVCLNSFLFENVCCSFSTRGNI